MRKLQHLLFVVQAASLLPACGHPTPEHRPDAGAADAADSVLPDATDASPPPPRPQDLFVPGADTALAYAPVLEDSTLAAGLARDAYGLRLAVIDFDDDGRTDLVLRGRQFLRGLGGGAFEDATAELFDGSPPTSEASETGAVFADADNDGDLDFFFHKLSAGVDETWTVLSAEGRGPELWVQERGVFRREDGALPPLADLVGMPGVRAMAAAWGDYDRDGLVDVAMGAKWTTVGCCPEDGFSSPDVEMGSFTFLFRNRGDGTFEDATALLVPPTYGGAYPFTLSRASLGHSLALDYAYAVAWGDSDDDGWDDLYVANYRLKRNRLWRNLGGSAGGFEEVGETLGVGGLGDFTSTGAGPYFGHSTGVDFGDLDNDGRLDLVVTNVSHANTPGVRFQDFSDNTQILIREDAGFVDRRAALGVQWKERHFSPSLADVNNDGMLDLFLATERQPGDGLVHHSDLYVAQGGVLAQVNESSGMGLRHDRAGVLADVDDDGDVDVVAGGTSSFDSLALFLNHGDASGARTHFVRLKLRGNGRTSNRSAIGARVEIDVADGRRLLREVRAGSGSGNQVPLVLHVGVGSIATTVDVRVRWPDGSSEVWRGLAVDATHELVER